MNEFMRFKNWVKSIKKEIQEKAEKMEHDFYAPDKNVNMFNANGRIEYYFQDISANKTTAKVLDYTLSVLAQVDNISVAFNNWAVKPVDNPFLLVSLLFLAVKRNIINSEEANRIFGSSMYYNKNHLDKCHSSFEEKTLFKELGSYYDKFGNFTESSSNYEYSELLSIVMDNKQVMEMLYTMSPENADVLKSLYQDFINLYQEYKQNLPEEKKVLPPVKKELPLIRFKKYLKDLAFSLNLNINKLNEKLEILTQFKNDIDQYGFLEAVRKNVEALGKISSAEIIQNDSFDGKLFDMNPNPQEEIDEIKHLTANLEEHKKAINTLINSFDNEKPFRYIDDILNLLNYLAGAVTTNILSLDEAIAIWGKTVYFNATHFKKINIDVEVYALEDITKISGYNMFFEFLRSYFDSDGKFKRNDNRLEEFMYKLCNFIFDNNGYQGITTSEKDYDIYDFIDEMSKSYQEFLGNTTTKEQAKSSEKKTEEKRDFRLKEYYKNGELIKIPEDMELFREILAASELTEDEKNNILRMVEDAKTEIKEDKYPFLNSEEKETLFKAQDLFFNKMTDFKYKQYYYELKQVLDEMDSLKDLFREAKSPEELYDLVEIKQELMATIAGILEAVADKNQVSTNNFIFLTDPQNKPYFTSDFAGMDNSLRKQALNLLGKINQMEQASFTSIKFRNEKTNLYQVYNGSVQIIFKELTAGCYLIVGLNVIRSDNAAIINRMSIPENQEFEKEVMVALNDNKKRNELLTEHEKYIPSVDKKTSLSREKPQN